MLEQSTDAVITRAEDDVAERDVPRGDVWRQEVVLHLQREIRKALTLTRKVYSHLHSIMLQNSTEMLELVFVEVTIGHHHQHASFTGAGIKLACFYPHDAVVDVAACFCNVQVTVLDLILQS